MPPNDVFEVINVDLHAFLERIKIIQGDESPGHIPSVVFGLLVGFFNIMLDLVVRAEIPDVRFGVFITHRLVGEKAKLLMRFNRPGDLFIDIRPNHLGTPVAMVRTDQIGDTEVVQQAGQDDFFIHAIFSRVAGAL